LGEVAVCSSDTGGVLCWRRQVIWLDAAQLQAETATTFWTLRGREPAYFVCGFPQQMRVRDANMSRNMSLIPHKCIILVDIAHVVLSCWA
jgi:hypothetical protein